MSQTSLPCRGEENTESYGAQCGNDVYRSHWMMKIRFIAASLRRGSPQAVFARLRSTIWLSPRSIRGLLGECSARCMMEGGAPKPSRFFSSANSSPSTDLLGFLRNLSASLHHWKFTTSGSATSGTPRPYTSSWPSFRTRGQAHSSGRICSAAETSRCCWGNAFSLLRRSLTSRVRSPSATATQPPNADQAMLQLARRGILPDSTLRTSVHARFLEHAGSTGHSLYRSHLLV